MDLKNGNRVHLINLDARYHRTGTYSNCATDGQDSMLGATQWTWLEGLIGENGLQSEVLIISSGIQVLPPLRKSATSSLCAYSGSETAFNAAITAIGEDGSNFGSGTQYESWAEIN